MRWIVLAVIVAAGTGQARAAEATKPDEGPLQPTAEELRDGFVSIFDGKTLEGWKGAIQGYVPENGLLVCQKKGGGNLFTVKEFGDFVLRFDFRFETGGNNGLSVRGHEIQILDDYAPQHKNIKPCQHHGSIYCSVPAKPGHTKPAGQWNSEEVTVQGSHWKVAVNGVTIVDVDLTTVPGKEALAKRTKGPLGFLGHGTRVEFRNLRVKELKPVPAAAK